MDNRQTQCLQNRSNNGVEGIKNSWMTSHSIHKRSMRSFQRWVFPGNQSHWYWQPKHHIVPKHKREKEKTVLANRTIYTPIWYAFNDLRSGNGAGPILTVSQPTWGTQSLICCSLSRDPPLPKLHKYPSTDVSVILLTDRERDRQTDKPSQIHNVFGSSNKYLKYYSKRNHPTTNSSLHRWVR